MRVSRTIEVEQWTDALAEKCLAYWRQRGFKFSQSGPLIFTGRRGNVWDNLTSFDMAKLMATINISVDGTSATAVMDVNTVFQMVTEWNAAFWQLEMVTWESWVLRGDLRESAWAEFRGDARAAVIKWALTGGRAGNRRT